MLINWERLLLRPVCWWKLDMPFIYTLVQFAQFDDMYAFAAYPSSWYVQAPDIGKFFMFDGSWHVFVKFFQWDTSPFQFVQFVQILICKFVEVKMCSGQQVQ